MRRSTTGPTWSGSACSGSAETWRGCSAQVPGPAGLPALCWGSYNEAKNGCQNTPPKLNPLEFADLILERDSPLFLSGTIRGAVSRGIEGETNPEVTDPSSH